VVTDKVTGEPKIEITFTDEGRRRFAEVTRQNIGRRLAIIIDGRAYSAPKMMAEIPGGRVEISGNFTQEQATDLARKMAPDDAQQLLKARDEAQLRAKAAEKKLVEAGMPVDSLGFDQARLERARQLAAAKSLDEQLAVYARYVTAARELERKVELEVTAGARPIDFREMARFERLQAEVELAQAAGRLP
jgi:hypothetical protein